MPWTTAALVLIGVAITVVLVVAIEVRLRPGAWRARRLPDGTQEARIVVEHGYRPSRVDLEAGVPAKLRFDRREDDPCTELLVSELWPNAHRLVAHGETEVRFTPQHPGRYVFTCGMGLYSGELLVHEGRAV